LYQPVNPSLDLARAAEDAGFSACFVTDHPAGDATWLDTGGHHALDPLVALSFAAADMWNTLSGPGTLRAGPGKVVGAQALALVSGIVRVGGAISAALNSELPAVSAGSPLEFDSITGSYRITNGVLTTRDLLYTSRPMKVAIAGQYGLANGRMDLDMIVTHARGELKAKVTGNAASPSIRVDPAAILKGVDREKVEKGLGDLLKRIR